MPYVSVHMTPMIAREEKERLISGITKVFVDVLDKDPNSTYVVLNEVDSDNWGAGGRSVSTLRRVREARPPRPAPGSLAKGQRALFEPRPEQPLTPLLLPHPDGAGGLYEVTYRYEDLDPSIFDAPLAFGLSRWAPLLPPLEEHVCYVEGATPLLKSPRLAAWAGVDELWLKLEGHNPTGSHKDRFNAVVTSAALQHGARGLVVATSGNNGASVAAYAARANLPCVILINEHTPAVLQRQIVSLGGALLVVPWADRYAIMGDLVRNHGFHPVSNTRGDVVTGHPFGPEGYKTIAYELYSQLGFKAPEVVYVPTALSELLFGVHKGFAELHRFGRIARTPRMIACEPFARGPLTRAQETGQLTARVDANPTDAFSIGVTLSSARGTFALKESGGTAMTVTDEEMRLAQRELAREGVWAELSACAGLAALRKNASGAPRKSESARESGRAAGPAVCIITAQGAKDKPPHMPDVPRLAATDGESVRQALRNSYGLDL